MCSVRRVPPHPPFWIYNPHQLAIETVVWPQGVPRLHVPVESFGCWHSFKVGVSGASNSKSKALHAQLQSLGIINLQGLTPPPPTSNRTWLGPLARRGGKCLNFRRSEIVGICILGLVQVVCVCNLGFFGLISRYYGIRKMCFAMILGSSRIQIAGICFLGPTRALGATRSKARSNGFSRSVLFLDPRGVHARAHPQVAARSVVCPSVATPCDGYLPWPIAPSY